MAVVGVRAGCGGCIAGVGVEYLIYYAILECLFVN